MKNFSKKVRKGAEIAKLLWERYGKEIVMIILAMVIVYVMLGMPISYLIEKFVFHESILEIGLSLFIYESIYIGTVVFYLGALILFCILPKVKQAKKDVEREMLKKRFKDETEKLQSKKL